MTDDLDLYDILGLLPTADDVVVRAAYKALAQRYHPDRWTGDKSHAERRMSELNIAYATLHDPDRRREYNARHAARYDDYPEPADDPPEADDEPATPQPRSDWDIALEYLPDLAEINDRFQRISARLAGAFRATLLDTKQFGTRRSIAERLQHEFLERHFGTQPEVVEYARWLFDEGHADELRELNRVVSVLGGDVDIEPIKARIGAKFGIGSGTVKALARAVLKHRSYESAERLLAALGGSVEKTWVEIGRVPSLALQVKVMGRRRSFSSTAAIVDWVVPNIAEKYAAQ